MTGRQVADGTAGLFVVAVATHVLLEARRLEYLDQGVPGAGFAPFWIGLGLALAGAATLVGTLRGGGAPPREAAEGAARPPGGLPGSVRVLGVTAAWVLVLPYAGLAASLALFLVALPLALGFRRIPLLLALAVAVPIVFHLVFERWLGVPLPRGAWF